MYYVDKGIRLFDQDKLNEAEDIFLDIIKSSTKDKAAILLATSHLGYLYEKLKQEELAKEFFIKTMELDPEDWNAMNHLAFLHIQDKEFEKSEEVLMKMLKIDFKPESTYHFLAIIYHNQALFAKSKECLKKSLGIDSQNDDIWVELGSEKEKLNKVNDAVNCYENALKINKLNSEAEMKLKNLREHYDLN